MPGVRTRITIDPKPLINAQRFVNKFDDVFEGTAQDAFDEVQPEFLTELQYTPGPAQNSLTSGEPFRWSSDPQADARARRWWFKHFPNGGERSGEMNDNWQVELKRVGEALQLLVSNPIPYLKWVVGSFDQRRNWQIPGHARTGWRLVNTTVSTFFDRFYGVFRQRFRESIPRAWGGTEARRRNR
jgi:hypothetical protein